MENFISSIKEKFSVFDKQFAETQEILKLQAEIKQKEREELLMKLRAQKNFFNQTIIPEFRTFLAPLQALFLERNLEIKMQSHKSKNPMFLYHNGDSPFLTLFVGNRTYMLRDRYDYEPFLMLKGDYQNNFIRLYECNPDRRHISYVEQNYINEPAAVAFHTEQYNLKALFPCIDAWIEKQLQYHAKH